MEPDYEAMPMDQLRNEAFPDESAAPVQQATEPTTTEPQEQQQQEPQQQEAPKVDEPPAWFNEYKKNTERELGSYRSLMSLKDKLPDLVSKQLEERLKALQAQQQTNPEDQQAAAQQAEAQKLIQKLAVEGVRQEFEPYAQLLERLQQQEQDSKYMGDVFSLVSDKVPNAKEAWDAIWKENAEKIESGDAEAINWQDRALKEPAFLALEILNRKSAEVQSQGANFVSNRQKAGAQAAQIVKNGAVQVQAKKSLNEMSQAELDALPTEELRQRTEAEGHFRG